MDLIREELDVLQADVDDESPQVLAAVVERALELGALDAHLCPLLMKKGRPGVRVEVLCRPADREALTVLLLRETSTLGVKARRVERYSLPRRFDEVQVAGHTIRIKVALARKSHQPSAATANHPHGSEPSPCSSTSTCTNTLSPDSQRQTPDFMGASHSRDEVGEISGLSDSQALRGVPEFEDCKKTAKLTGLAVKDVIAQAAAAWRGVS